MGKLAPSEKARNKRGPQLDEDWQTRFLRAYEEFGAKWKAARVAGVAKRTVDAYEAADEEFAEKLRDAKQLYLDECQVKLREIADQKGNPLPLFGILKAGRPDEWGEPALRAPSLTLNINGGILDDDGAGLLRTMLKDATSATLQRLGAPATHPDILEAEIVQPDGVQPPQETL